MKQKLIFLTLLSLLLIVGTSNVANALSFTSPFDGSIVSCDVDGKESITVKVVSCIKTVVIAYTTAFLSFMSDVMWPVVLGLASISVVFTAMRIMLLERNPQKIMVGALIKIIFVLMLSNNFGANSGMFDEGGLQEVTFATMEGMQVMIVENMYEDSETCKLSEHNGKASGVISADGYKPFAYMDCILEYIMGFNTAAGIGASLLGFTASALFSGTMGATVFFFGIATLLAITFFVLKVVFTVIISYVYAGLLISIAPLLAWTIMFRYTEDMFFKYLYNIIEAIFMPFMMIAFMAFAIPLLDSYVLSKDNPRSLVNVLGEATAEVKATGVNANNPPKPKIMDHYRTESPICSVQMPTDPLFAQGLDQNQIRENSSNPIATGSVDWCAGLEVNSVDLGKDHHNKLWKIAQSLLQILFIVWIITTIGNQVPALTARILRSGGELSRVLTGGMPIEGWAQGQFRSQAVAAQNSGAGIGAGTSMKSLLMPKK